MLEPILRARVAIGDSTAGDASSANNKVTFGSITSEEPVLEMIVVPGVSNLWDTHNRAHRH